jgi:16S rRNA (cytosine1402-N4)-methyltransferase
MNSNHHKSVMLDESIESLKIKGKGIYVDATFGRGGHTSMILNSLQDTGRLIAIDKDLDAIDYAKNKFNDSRFEIYHDSFINLDKLLKELNLFGQIDGILMDLGVSSPQIDNPDRGFSFNNDGPLDMRMDQTKGISAAEWIATATEEEIANIIYQFGEEKRSRRIAKAIKKHQQDSVINTTTQLANIISSVVGGKQKKHPATRSFQAIRIFINEELQQLINTLDKTIDMLAPGGRLCIISFHSIEDRIVKKFIQKHSRQKSIPKGLPIMDDVFEKKLLIDFGKLFATKSEISSNIRSRSAILRVAEKC